MKLFGRFGLAVGTLGLALGGCSTVRESAEWQAPVVRADCQISQMLVSQRESFEHIVGFSEVCAEGKNLAALLSGAAAADRAESARSGQNVVANLTLAGNIAGAFVYNIQQVDASYATNLIQETERRYPGARNIILGGMENYRNLSERKQVEMTERALNRTPTGQFIFDGDAQDQTIFVIPESGEVAQPQTVQPQ